jgi:hypothetical protein
MAAMLPGLAVMLLWLGALLWLLRRAPVPR